MKERLKELLCSKHGWTNHIIHEDCFCDKGVESGYTYSDENGDCDECIDSPPKCIKCMEELAAILNVKLNRLPD